MALETVEDRATTTHAEDFPEAVVDGVAGVLAKPRARGWIHVYAAVVAILTAALLALASCAVMVVMRRDNAPFAALPIGISLYALWVLIWRFA